MEGGREGARELGRGGREGRREGGREGSREGRGGRASFISSSKTGYVLTGLQL